MAMLNSLVIKNFRMLEDFTVEKLGRVNLIVGKNNSGKSTVLEALRIYAGNANFDLLNEIAASHDEKILPNRNDKSLISNFIYPDLFLGRELSKLGIAKILIGESDEYDSDKNLLIKRSFVVANDTVDYMYHLDSINEAELNENNFRICEQSILVERGKRHGSISSFESLSDFLSCQFIATQFISIKELEHDWNEINLTEAEEIVIETLQIILPTVRRLAFDGEHPNRWIKLKLNDVAKPVPLKSLGDGIIRILQIALKLATAQGGFLLIDEFENGLHYSVQENVWRLLFEMAEKLDIQVFATTHSWDCIESFITVAQQNPEADAVLFRMGRSVRKSNQGQVIATIFSGEELAHITQSNMEIR